MTTKTKYKKTRSSTPPSPTNDKKKLDNWAAIRHNHDQLHNMRYLIGPFIVLFGMLKTLLSNALKETWDNQDLSPLKWSTTCITYTFLNLLIISRTSKLLHPWHQWNFILMHLATECYKAQSAEMNFFNGMLAELIAQTSTIHQVLNTASQEVLASIQKHLPSLLFDTLKDEAHIEIIRQQDKPLKALVHIPCINHTSLAMTTISTYFIIAAILSLHNNSDYIQYQSGLLLAAFLQTKYYQHHSREQQSQATLDIERLFPNPNKNGTARDNTNNNNSNIPFLLMTLTNPQPTTELHSTYDEKNILYYPCLHHTTPFL